MAGQAIHDLREFRNTSVGELAKYAGITPARLSSIEHGEVDPTSQEVLDFALCLDVPASLIDGFHPYREGNEDLENLRTILGHLDRSPDFDLVITWPGGISRRYPVDDMARDLFEFDPDETPAFQQIQTLDNRMLLISNLHERQVSFLPPQVRSDIPARKPFPYALVEGIKDVAYDLEPSAPYSKRYGEQLADLLATIPAGSDAYGHFLDHRNLAKDDDEAELPVDERVGDLIDYAACIERSESLVFDFDDGYEVDIVVDLSGFMLIDVPLNEILDEMIGGAVADDE